MIKAMHTLSFRQYKMLGLLIDANGGISPMRHISASQRKMKMEDFLVLEKRGLAKADTDFGRKVFFIADGFSVEELDAYQKIRFETSCCSETGDHQFVADGYVHCLDCGNTHAKLRMVKNG